MGGDQFGEFVCGYWVIPEKIHTPTMEGMLENPTGGGVNSSGNSDVGGALNLKIHPRGVTFDFIDVSIATMDKFSKNCFAFSNFIFLSNYMHAGKSHGRGG